MIENKNDMSRSKTQFFSTGLSHSDKDLFQAVQNEFHRQSDEIELIASENIVSRAVLEAQGSILTNKYAEGYPGHRYYGGCQYVDIAEELAIKRACQLFDCQFACVQPHSGSQANQAVFYALLKPGDTFMGMSLDAGGHLTHGAKPNLSGKWFNPVFYGVRAQDSNIDYDHAREVALTTKPKLIIAGGTVVPRIVDFSIFREIANEVGAYLMVDMAHFAGLVAGRMYPSPINYADVVTTTTHKTLRGPRGGMILTNDEKIAKKMNSSIFPGMQGGPLMHVIAAKAVAFGEALKPEFKTYVKAVVDNARAFSDQLMKGGLNIITGGTDTHLLWVDLTPLGITGLAAEKALGRANITCNKNTIPNDPKPPTVTSGVRLGTPAATTRGFDESAFRLTADFIIEVLKGLSEQGEQSNKDNEQSVKAKVIALCRQYPIYDRL